MIAQFPMYLRPGNLAAHQAFWACLRDGLRDRGVNAPEEFDLSEDYDAVWARPDLCLSQVCNLPLRTLLKDRLTPIAACDYGLEGCAPGFYRSLFVVRADHPAMRPEDLSGARMAYNDALSHSGWGAAWQWATKRGLWFQAAMKTGAHIASLEAVVAGAVDFAVIDAQSFREFEIDTALTQQVRVIGATEASPGQTFCTRAGQDPAPYRAALREALETLPTEHRDRLGLRGIVALPPAAYDLPVPPAPADWHKPTESLRTSFNQTAF